MDKKSTVPGLAPGAFNFVACVDWVELEISTSSPTNPQTIRDHFPASLRFGAGAVPMVEPRDGLPNGTASVFRFKVQEPRSAEAVRAGLVDLADRFPMAREPEITAVEIACDARPLNGDRSELVEAAHYLQWGHRLGCFRKSGVAPPLWRAVTRGGRPVSAVAPEFDRAFVRDALASKPCSLLTGDRDAQPILLRVYVKDADNAGRTPYPCSARFEVRLTGDSLPFRTVGEWSKFKFERLARDHFSWLVCPADRLAEVEDERRTQLMTRAGDPVVKGRPALDGWRPHTELNRRVRRALQRLTVRQGAHERGIRTCTLWAPLVAPLNDGSKDIDVYLDLGS